MAACQGVAGGEQEYFQEKRNLEDLWLSAFPIGTEWENIEKIKEFNWNFQNLELAEGGGRADGDVVKLEVAAKVVAASSTPARSSASNWVVDVG